MQVPRADAGVHQVVGEVLGHALGERGDDDALVGVHAPADLAHQVVHLILGGPHLHLGVDEPRGPDDLLHHARRVVLLELAGRGRHEHDLPHALEELLKAQRPVVGRRRQPEAVLDQGHLARAVALVHSAQLRHGVVRLVDEREEVGREEVEQRVRGLAGRAAVEDARVVLDSRAEAHLAQHLHVVLGALTQAVALHQLALSVEQRAALFQFGTDLTQRALDDVGGRDVVRGRVDGRVLEIAEHLAGDRVEVRDLLDLVAEHRHPVGRLGVDRLNLEHIAARAEAPALQHHVVALVLHLHQALEQLVARDLGTLLQKHQALAVAVGRPHAVDARHRRDDHHIATRQQRGRGRVAQAVDLVVDRGVLLDVRVAGRDVRLGLVVVVVRDEVLDRRARQVLAKLVAQLRGKGLVVGDHQCGPARLGDDVGHGEGLARAGDAEQRLVALARREPRLDRRDGVRLVAGGQVRIGDRVRGGGHCRRWYPPAHLSRWRKAPPHIL